MRSAVNVGRLPQVIVPDNSHVIGVAKSIGSDIRQGMDKRKAEKEAADNKERAASLAKEIFESRAVGDIPQAVRPQYDPETELRLQQVDLAEKKRLDEIHQKSENAKRATIQASNQRRVLSDADSKANFVELAQLDPQMARTVFQMVTSADEQDRLAVAQEAKRANDLFQNAAYFAKQDLNGGKGGQLDAFLVDAIRQESARGGDVSRLYQMYKASPDERIGLIQRNLALSGTVLKNPEVQKGIIVADGSELRNPVTGELIARNNKDIDPNAAGSLAERKRANDLRADELANAKNKIPANVENNIVKSQEAAFESRNNSGHLETLAQEFERTDLDSGSSAVWTERIKEISGQEDEVTLLRKKYTRLKNTQALKSLPPGAASDSDVALAMEGFLGATADPKQIASFLRGLAKMEQINADFHEFRANYMSEEKSAAGFGKAWREHSKEAYRINEGLSDDDLFGKYGIK